MKNTKGLSGVITTLIIILLVIAAIGIIWAVVNPFIQGAGGDIDVATKCMGLDVIVQSVTCTAGDTCAVTFKRGSDGETQPDGIRLLFYNEDRTKNYIQNVALVADALDELEMYTPTDTINANTGTDGLLENASTLSIAPYYTDGSGNPAYCDEAGSYNVVDLA